MKIKEVSKKTGLTEKTIRYYEEKGLIDPVKTTVKDREFREYTNRDIKDLLITATLRKLDFGISDILKMIHAPGEISGIVRGHIERIKETNRLSTSMLTTLEDTHTDKLTDIYELAGALENNTKHLSLPETDLDIPFYKLDGMTKDELDTEMIKYGQREKARVQKSLKNSFIIFGAVFLLFICLLIFQWTLIKYLPYLNAPYSSNIGILPYVLLVFTGIAVFVTYISMHRYISSGNDDAVIKGIKRLRLFTAILLIYTATGFFAHVKIQSTLENTKLRVTSTVMDQWYPLFQMTRYTDRFFDDPLLFGDKRGFALYVNQLCYSYPHADMLRSKTADLLIWSYDILFKEISYETSRVDKDAAEKILIDLNESLGDLCRQIIDLPDSQKAELALADSEISTKYRNMINMLADEFISKTESLFK